MIKAGVPARWVEAALGHFLRGCTGCVPLLKVSRRTLARKAVADERLRLAESESAVGLAQLIGQIEAMVIESGATEGFSAAAWLAAWANIPLPALNGERPIEYLETWEGRVVISRFLAQMQVSTCA